MTVLGRLTYLGLLLPWSLLVVVGQWVISGGSIRRQLRLVAATVAPCTAYLVGADALALSQGIWHIHSDRIIGIHLGNVPVEEALFFLLSNLMVVQGLVLFNSPEPRALLGRLRRRRSAAGRPDR